MRRRFFYALVAVVTIIVLTGMGGSGGFERAPRVEKNYSVTVVDSTGNTIRGEKFSWEGRIHFSGYLGMARVTLPFDKIKDMAVGEQKERNMRVTAHLMDGTETIFDVDAKSRCFGEASFGSFMLQMDEIKTVVFNRT